LNSARRHNRSILDDNGFAALVAAVIVAERRIGNVPPYGNDRDRKSQAKENLAALVGCTVSGRYINDALERGDRWQVIKYLLNWETPDGPPLDIYPTVGIGNVSLYTAANLWKGQACNSSYECVPAQVSGMKTTNPLGWQVDMPNPFGPQMVCGGGGFCGTAEPSETQSYSQLTMELMDNEKNIEYVAANLEAGAIRATTLGVEPNAFNLAMWHAHGVLSDEEIKDYKQIFGRKVGSASNVLNDMPTALNVLGVTSSWNANQEQRHLSCMGGGWPCD
jgi:hypothetical protein